MRVLPLIAPLLIGAVALAACGKQSSSTTTIATNAATGVTTATTSGAPVTGETLGIQSGNWQTTITVTDQKVEGAPAGSPVPPKVGPQTITACVTPEQAKANPADMLRKAKANCTITNSVYAGGRIASKASCKMPNGAMTVDTTGTYSSTSIETDSQQSIAMGPMRITTTTHSASRRLGECS